MHNEQMDPSSAVTKLMGAGMTEQGIAAALQINQSTVNRIRRRVVAPSYDVGKALVDMAGRLPSEAKSARRRRVNH